MLALIAGEQGRPVGVDVVAVRVAACPGLGQVESAFDGRVPVSGGTGALAPRRVTAPVTDGQVLLGFAEEVVAPPKSGGGQSYCQQPDCQKAEHGGDILEYDRVDEVPAEVGRAHFGTVRPVVCSASKIWCVVTMLYQELMSRSGTHAIMSRPRSSAAHLHQVQSAHGMPLSEVLRLQPSTALLRRSPLNGLATWLVDFRSDTRYADRLVVLGAEARLRVAKSTELPGGSAWLRLAGLRVAVS